MHLVYRALEGDPVPLTLHGKLIPPSKRKLKLSSSAPSSPSPKGLTPPSVSSSVLSTGTVSFILNQWNIIQLLGPENIHALPSPLRIGQPFLPLWGLVTWNSTWKMMGYQLPKYSRKRITKLKFLNLWMAENHLLYDRNIKFYFLKNPILLLYKYVGQGCNCI